MDANREGRAELGEGLSARSSLSTLHVNLQPGGRAEELFRRNFRKIPAGQARVAGCGRGGEWEVEPGWKPFLKQGI